VRPSMQSWMRSRAVSIGARGGRPACADRDPCMPNRRAAASRPAARGNRR
jgi:hypothetical protein